MSKSILDFYSYPEIYPEHRELLLAVESNIEKYDIFLIIAPVAAGKTAIAQAISRWHGSVCHTVPTNELLRQELRDYPDSKYIIRKDLYESEAAYKRSLEAARDVNTPILCVPHSYISHKIRRDILIMDEGHRISELNRELYEAKVLKDQFNYADSIGGVTGREDFLNMLQFEAASPSTRGNDKRAKRILKLISEMTYGFQESRANGFMLNRSYEYLRGRRKDMLKVVPLNPPLHHLFKRNRKLILMSATLSMEDIKSLHLGETKKCLILEIPSRIPVDRRPLIRSYIGNVNYANANRLLPEMAERIRDIGNFHADSKGIVHLTYELLSKLRPYFERDARYMFHVKTGEVLRSWLRSPGNEILLAAGCEEGLNLKGDRFQFQIIGKIPWLNQSDIGVRKRMEISPASYIWETIRKVMQMYGRICRGEADFGASYVIDGSYDRLYNSATAYDLVPKWFRDVN